MRVSEALVHLASTLFHSKIFCLRSINRFLLATALTPQQVHSLYRRSYFLRWRSKAVELNLELSLLILVVSLQALDVLP